MKERMGHIIEGPADVGEVFHFRSPDEPHFDCDLKVERVEGPGPDDMVFFHDGTWSYQGCLSRVRRTLRDGKP